MKPLIIPLHVHSTMLLEVISLVQFSAACFKEMKLFFYCLCSHGSSSEGACSSVSGTEKRITAGNACYAGI